MSEKVVILADVRWARERARWRAPVPRPPPVVIWSMEAARAWLACYLALQAGFLAAWAEALLRAGEERR